MKKTIKKKEMKEGRDFSLADEVKELTDASSKFGLPQRMEGDKLKITMEKAERMLEYMIYEVPDLNLPKSVLDSCTNRNELCTFWAALGEVRFLRQSSIVSGILCFSSQCVLSGFFFIDSFLTYAR
jgi:hypothetical protein